MRSIIALSTFMIMLFTCGTLLHAQTSSAPSEVRALIRAGLGKNYDAIRERSQSMQEYERMYMYDTHQKSPALATLANLLIIPGFAVGSMAQLDPLGFLVAGANIGVLVFSKDDYSWLQTYAILTAVSLALPSIYTYRYNSKLERALNLSDFSSIDVAPAIGRLADGTPTLKINVSVGF